jgi:hypothetical protein
MVYYILIYSIIIIICIVCIVFYIFYNLSNKWNENSFQVIEHYILYIIIFRVITTEKNNTTQRNSHTTTDPHSKLRNICSLVALLLFRTRGLCW